MPPFARPDLQRRLVICAPMRNLRTFGIAVAVFIMWSSTASANPSQGRTASELENPYSWEESEHPGTAGQESAHPRPTPPGPPTPTPDSSRQDSFYERYFRKGKRIEGPDLPTLPSTPRPVPTIAVKQTTPVSPADRQAEEIASLMQDLVAEPHRRQAAVERLSMIGAPAVPALRRALQNPYKFARIGALEALGYIHSQEALPDILRCLKDKEENVRAEALKTLARLRHRTAVSAIAERLADPQPRVRREAVLALGRIKGSGAQAALITAARSNLPEIRGMACEELSAFPTSESVQTLLEATADSDRETRLAAIRSLGDIGDPAARARLQTLGRDQDRMVRQAAQQALENLE